LNDIVLGSGEIALEIDTDNRVWGKVGDGVQTYSQMPYVFGDKGIPLAGTNVGEPVTGLIEFEAATVNGPVTLAQVDNALGANNDAVIWDATGAADTSFVFKCRNSVTGANNAFAFSHNGQFVLPSESAVDGGSWAVQAATVLAVPNTLLWASQDYLGAQTSHAFAIATGPTSVFTFNTDGTITLGRETVDGDPDLAAASKKWVEDKIAAAIAALP
ncbi:unnamed protein product, partial [marine sediment metagenome]